MEFDFSKEPGKSLLERELVNSEAPLVSIITPFYNSGKYFEQACNSILNQTFPWFEWIIIDNGSTDIDSLNLLESVKKKDSRIKVFYRETSSDDFTINKKILKTATDIIVPFNVSNILNPTFLEVTYWALSLNPKYSCVYTDFVVFQNKEYLCEKKININTLNKTDSLFPTVAICKKDFIEIGLYNFFGRTEYEEQKSWIQLLETGKKIIRVPIYGFWYRCRDEKKVEVIENNRKFRKKTQKKITEQVKKTSDDAELKEYPYATPLNTYAPIKFSNWDEKKSVFKKKRKTHIMLLIPWMEMGGADAFNLEVVKKIDKDKYEVSILTTVHGKQSWRQYFEEYVRDIFEMPTFLNVENYPEFISYFIKS